MLPSGNTTGDPAAELLRVFVEELKDLDAEAVLSNGTGTGLWWYGRYLQGDGPRPKKYRNEEDIFAALRRRLISRGSSVDMEKCYPAVEGRRRKQRCDLVLIWPKLGRIWVEVKGAWRHNDRPGLQRNRSYFKHLHSAAEDAAKLLKVDPTAADYLALLLIAFDQQGDPIPASDIDIVRRQTRDRGWREQSMSWDDHFRSAGKVTIWLWTFPVTKASETPPRSSPLAG